MMEAELSRLSGRSGHTLIGYERKSVGRNGQMLTAHKTYDKHEDASRLGAARSTHR